MNKRYGMSPIGYAIATVILIGIVMIFSTPMIIDSYDVSKKNNNNNNNNSSNYVPPSAPPVSQPSAYNNENTNSNSQDYIDVTRKLGEIEERLTMRIADLEQRQNNITQTSSQEQSSSVSDKYVCSIEGLLADNGDVVPLNDSHIENTTAKKFVFVCEYKK